MFWFHYIRERQTFLLPMMLESARNSENTSFNLILVIRCVSINGSYRNETMFQEILLIDMEQTYYSHLMHV